MTECHDLSCLLKKLQSKCGSKQDNASSSSSGTKNQQQMGSSVKAARGEREVVQWHFTAWPDHATPPSPVALLHFVRRSAQSNPTNAGPIVVHCR